MFYEESFSNTNHVTTPLASQIIRQRGAGTNMRSDASSVFNVRDV